MGVTYFKRYRMEIDLRRWRLPATGLPRYYRIVSWRRELLAAHAEAKVRSFQGEIDAQVFPCLGEPEGCARLMEDIANKEGFLPEATWLLDYLGPNRDEREHCGTIQGIRANARYGCIQNIGVTPSHRGQGLAQRLLDYALLGFQQVGLLRAGLEVTAQNRSAVLLYQRYGFRRTKTLFKAVEEVWA